MLSSIKFKDMYFDYGTHIAFKINHKKLDKILFDKLDKKEWNIFKKSVREGIYNFGRLDKNSGTLDARNLEKEKIVKEWMEERRQLLRSYDRIVTPRIEISTLPTIYEE